MNTSMTLYPMTMNQMGRHRAAHCPSGWLADGSFLLPIKVLSINGTCAVNRSAHLSQGPGGADGAI